MKFYKFFCHISIIWNLRLLSMKFLKLFQILLRFQMKPQGRSQFDIGVGFEFFNMSPVLVWCNLIVTSVGFFFLKNIELLLWDKMLKIRISVFFFEKFITKSLNFFGKKFEFIRKLQISVPENETLQLIWGMPSRPVIMSYLCDPVYLCVYLCQYLSDSERFLKNSDSLKSYCYLHLQT